MKPITMHDARALRKLEDALAACANLETGNHLTLYVLTDFLTGDPGWTERFVQPESRAKLIALAERLKQGETK